MSTEDGRSGRTSAPTSASLTCQLAFHARAGLPGGFEALYDRLSPALLAWARMPTHRHLSSQMDPEDFVQEVWINASRHLDAFTPERASFRRWIFGIAKNLSIDLLRRHARGQSRGVPLALGGSSLHELGRQTGGDPSTWLQVAHSEAFESFLATVERLSLEEQLLFVHCGMEELTAAQVADRLDISPAAAQRRWHRLRTRLIDRGLPAGIIE